MGVLREGTRSGPQKNIPLSSRVRHSESTESRDEEDRGSENLQGEGTCSALWGWHQAEKKQHPCRLEKEGVPCQVQGHSPIQLLKDEVSSHTHYHTSSLVFSVLGNLYTLEQPGQALLLCELLLCQDGGNPRKKLSVASWRPALSKGFSGLQMRIHAGTAQGSSSLYALISSQQKVGRGGASAGPETEPGRRS